IDREFQFGFAGLGPVRAAKRGALQILELPAWVLRARAARKIRPRGARGGKRRYHNNHPLRWAPFVGERCPKALVTPGGRLGQAAFGGVMFQFEFLPLTLV